jgi:hypothetical protein
MTTQVRSQGSTQEAEPCHTSNSASASLWVGAVDRETYAEVAGAVWQAVQDGFALDLYFTPALVH